MLDTLEALAEEISDFDFRSNFFLDIDHSLADLHADDIPVGRDGIPIDDLGNHYRSGSCGNMGRSCFHTFPGGHLAIFPSDFLDTFLLDLFPSSNLDLLSCSVLGGGGVAALFRNPDHGPGSSLSDDLGMALDSAFVDYNDSIARCFS